MAGLGIEKGESVAIIHPNGREGVVASYATLYGGYRATMINLAAGPNAIAFALEHLGRMDADGYVFVTGRLKELIINGGENIAPLELDEVLYGLNDVVEVAASHAFAHNTVNVSKLLSQSFLDQR
ncbi:putative sulfoacetate--CoA ligase [Octadecabacter ascidiaceicola]|uniref:Putative sulfoacetate--CoA ligase n=1 Tax=Octadecabacter ascidiaceicola TaxID=1655543 RepID=A0A238KK40_9RHOB|nr:putative sulfoacetate--CoA ligase [Octadecabacter ascidiaceicola]